MLFCQQERLRAFHHLPCYVHHRWFPTENKFILPFIKVLFLSERVFVIPFPPFKHKPWLAEFTGAFHTNTFQGIYYFFCIFAIWDGHPYYQPFSRAMTSENTHRENDTLSMGRLQAPPSASRAGTQKEKF